MTVGMGPASLARRALALLENGAASLAILAIRTWQIGPSRLLPPSCRFTPSCSAYAIDAIRTHGPLRGGGLTVWRLARCHPWGGCGCDPVPPRRARAPSPETPPALTDPRPHSDFV